MRHPRTSLLIGVIMAALLGEAGAATCAAPNATYPLCADEACVGRCNAGSGCLCTVGNSTCLPNATVTCNKYLFPNPPPGCCPQGLFWHPDIQCCSEEMYCAPACKVDQVCTNVTGTAQCQCNETYYGQLNSSDIIPTLTCPSGSNYPIVMTIPKCMLTLLHYDYTRAHPLNIGCTMSSNEQPIDGVTQVTFRAYLETGWCGNIMTVTSDMVTYSNVLYIPPDTSSGFIHSNPLNFSYSCSNNLTMQTSLTTAFYPFIPPVNPVINGFRSYTANMVAYHSASYTDPYTVDTSVPMGTPVYIAITGSAFDRNIFALRAARCVASPTNSASDPNAVVLIDGGCAVNQVHNTQVLSNRMSWEVRFSVNMFSFQNQPAVYMFCDVRMCQLSKGNCSAVC